MYRYFLKPLFDFLLSFVGVLILSPLFLILIIAIKVDSRGPILFKQKRVGKNKKLFHIYKFRTMRIDTPKDTPTHLLENPQQYITKVGRFLRKSSLDELPQIFNILFGKMSIVGPRPALWNQDDLIALRDKYGANRIKPGLTGWAQVNGRDELLIEKKAELDGEYAKKRNVFFDIKIFFMTIHKIFKREGVVEGGTGTIAIEKTNVQTAENNENIENTGGADNKDIDGGNMESITEEAACVQEEILILNSQSEELQKNEEYTKDNESEERNRSVEKNIDNRSE